MGYDPPMGYDPDFSLTFDLDGQAFCDANRDLKCAAEEILPSLQSMQSNIEYASLEILLATATKSSLPYRWADMKEEIMCMRSKTAI
jgi:hypothetical protein